MSMLGALQDEIAAVRVATARVPTHVRVSPEALAGSITTLPIVDESEVGQLRAMMGLNGDYEIPVVAS